MTRKTSENVNVVRSPLAYSAQQLADRLGGVSLRHIRRQDSAGKLPKPIRLGRSVLWVAQEIEDWLAAGAPDRQRWEVLKGSRR